MGDRVAVLRNGVLQQLAEPQRLYDSPANIFVAGFIGTPPMNLLEAKVSVGNGGVTRLGSAAPSSRCRTPRSRPTRGCVATAAARSSRAWRSQYLFPATARPELPTLTGPRRPRRGARRASRSSTSTSTPRPWGRRGQHEDDEEPAGDGGGRRRVAAEPRRAVPGLYVAAAAGSDEIPVAVDVARMHFFDPESGEPLRYSALSSARCSGVALVARGIRCVRACRPAPAGGARGACACLGARERPDLLRDARSLRERRPVERHGRRDRQPVGDRVRPELDRLVPRRRLQGPHRHVHRSRSTASRASRTSASTRSG